MTGLFGGRSGKKPAAVAAEDEGIPEDLLNSIPEEEQGASGGAGAEGDDVVELAVETPPPRVEVDALLGEARKGMEDVLRREMDHVQQTFGQLVRQMEARLRAATEQLKYMEQERTQLEQANAAYERKFAQLKAIANDD